MQAGNLLYLYENYFLSKIIAEQLLVPDKKTGKRMIF